MKNLTIEVVGVFGSSIYCIRFCNWIHNVIFGHLLIELVQFYHLNWRTGTPGAGASTATRVTWV